MAKQAKNSDEKSSENQADEAIEENTEEQDAKAGKGPADIIIEEQKAKIADLEDKMLRAVAEGQNIKRRAEQDIQKARNFSIEGFAKDLVGVLDNLYRAADSITEEDAKENEKLKNTKEGVEITKNELIRAFEKNGISRIYPLDQPFDHNLHQAMSQVEIADKPANNVIEVIQAGYTINGRLLRAAMVVVSK